MQSPSIYYLSVFTNKKPIYELKLRETKVNILI